MGGGGKSSTTTSQVSIPPEVLARYNAVNARAENVAATPFQPYQGQFVAGLTPTQQQGIAATSQAAGQAQPYYQAATQQLQQAQQQGQQGLAAAQPFMQQGVQAGQQLGGEAYNAYQALPQIFMPSMQQAQQGIQQGLGAGQALLGGGLGYALSGAQPITPQQFSGQAINQYMSPFMGNVVQQTMAAQAQQNAQQRRALTGEAIKSGAFGGDRSGIAQANLAYQQNLANQQTLANLLQGGYGQALGAFQQQQGVNLAAEQANRQALQQTGQALAGLGQQAFGMGTGAAQQQAGLGQALAGMYGQQAQGLAGLGQQQFGQGLTAAQQQAQLAQQGYGMGAGTAQALAGLGTGAQAAALQGAQAQLGAGTLEQQTQQADLTARYQQFLQERGYPFQVAQFLANIAMGTGALSGSTTTTQQPAGFFSDKRLKEDAEQIGHTNDGQPIYRFKYKGDPRYQIGLMAQDVAKEHPEAVGKHDGYLTVDYKVATDEAAERRAQGGLVPNRMGGVVGEAGDYAHGGRVPRQHLNVGGDADFIKAILQSQQQAFGQVVGGTPYGEAGAGTPGAKIAGYVPKPVIPISKFTPASPPSGQQPSGVSSVMNTGKSIAEVYKAGKEGYQDFRKTFLDEKKPDANKQNQPTPASQKTAAASTAKSTEPPRSGGQVSYDTGKGEGAFYLPGTDPNAPGSMVSVKDAADTGMSVREIEPEDILFAFGGVVPRQGYAGLGKVVDPMELQDPSKGINAYIEDAAESQEDTSDDKIAGAGGSGGAGKGRSGFDDVKDAASVVGTGLKIAGTVASLFSDKRLKDNIEKVGELNDGQNVYRYDFGNGRTQLGLLAQEVLKKKPDAVGKRDGYLTVDYDKATEGAIRRAMGGMARHGYALEGEVVEQPEVDGGGGADEAVPAKATPAQAAPEHPAFTIIRKREGFREQPYWDVNALRGGYGTDTFTTADGKVMPVTAETRFTKEDAERDLNRRIPEFQNIAQNKVGAETWQSLNPNVQGALTSVTYNYGTLPNSVAEAVRSGDNTKIAQAVNALGTHNKGINAGRRAEEAAMIDPNNEYKPVVGLGVASSRADMPSEKGRPVEYEGGDASAGFSIPGGEKFWVPALSLVGSMLASKSPTLGGAIGEGIVGGVAGYQVQQKMAADLAKSVLDIVKDRFNVTTDQKTGETRYFNKSTGELLTPGQFKQAVAGVAGGLGVDPAVLGITPAKAGGFNIPGGVGQPVPSIQAPGTSAAPGAVTTPQGTQPGTPAGAPAAPSTTEQAQVVEDITRMNKPQLQDDVLKNPQKYKLTGDRDPNYLTQQITERKQRALNASNQGNAAEASRLDAEAKDLEDRRKQILEDAVDLQYKTNVALQDAQTKSYNDYLTEAHKRQVAYVNVRKDMKRLADLYATDVTPERLQGLKTEVTDIAASLGVNVFSREFENAAFDEAMKIALMQAAKQVDQLGLTRAPGAAMENTIKTVPAPLLAKGAAYALVGRTIGDLDYWANVDKNFLKEPRGTSPTEYLITYNDKYKDETPEKYIKRAFENDVRPVKGMDRRNIESIRRSYNVERIPGAEPVGAPAGGQAQPAAPAAPPVPEPLRGAEGLVYSPSRNQYRDAQGNIYDASGRRVQ